MASQHHDQQKGGDRYYIILILLNNLLLSTKLLATVSLHHLDVQNNKQSIFGGLEGFYYVSQEEKWN